MTRTTGVQIHLPDCIQRTAPHALSARQRREIIQALAKDGKKGLDAWLREEEKRDPYIRKRVQEDAGRLEREARMEERRIDERYGREKKQAETAWERDMNARQAAEASLRQRIEKARAGNKLSLADLARDSSLFAAVADEDVWRSPFQIIGAWVARLWLALVRWVVGLVRGTRKMATGKPDKAHVIQLPDGIELDLKGLTTWNPRVIAQVRLRMREGKSMRERIQQAWNRMLGKEDYAAMARTLMEDELKARKIARTLDVDAEAGALEARLKELEKSGYSAARAHRDEVKHIDEKRTRDLEELKNRVHQGPYERARDEILSDLRESGLVDDEGEVTDALLDRFSTFLYDEARRTLPSGGSTSPGTFAGGEGEYHKAPLQSLNERGSMELVDSVVQARLRHPRVRHLYDQDLIVHREVRTSRTHVVLIMDQSGSMEEKGRLDAAKAVCLVMYRAVKEADPMNRVDVLAMSTGIQHMTLGELWHAEPKGFTNHGAALREARYLLETEGADRRIVYLITDGLPEAMTVNGVDTADRPEVCMPYALQQAKELAAVEGTRLFVIQLETQQPSYVDAARRIASAAGGVVEAVEPSSLTETLLVDFETERAALKGE